MNMIFFIKLKSNTMSTWTVLPCKKTLANVCVCVLETEMMFQSLIYDKFNPIENILIDLFRTLHPS